MGVMPINKLLIGMSLPMMISMLVQALYNVVDSIFVSKLNDNAFTALSLAFPIQNLMIAVSAGTCVGINALLSRRLGEKRFEEANKAAMNGILLALVGSVLFAIFGFTLAEKFFTMQTDDPEIIKYGTQYLSICTIFSFGIFLQMTFERLLQSTGKTFYNMITQSTGAVINIILDPILIFGLFGFPRLEVIGSAVATVIGQVVAMLLTFYFNKSKNHDLSLRFRGFRPDFKTISTIYAVGIPSIIMQSIGSVMVFGLNKILISYTSVAVAVFGAYFRLQSFIFMPIFGLINGMIPIVAYNYGAKNKKRIVDTIKLSAILAVGIMSIGLLLFQIIPERLLGIFHASEEMLKIGVPALRIISLAFVFAGFGITASSVFQALGNGIHSMIISIARQLVVILPVAFIFSEFFGLKSIWWCFPIAEIVSLILCAYFLKRNFEKKINVLYDVEIAESILE
jgi:putative MATE family efflux protein